MKWASVRGAYEVRREGGVGRAQKCKALEFRELASTPRRLPTGEGFEYNYGLWLVSAVWLRVFDVGVSPSWLGDGKGGGLDGLDS